jgi:hypothetical protein
MTDDRRRGADSTDAEAEALVDRLFAPDRAAIAQDTQDELGHRRALAQVYDRYHRLTPEETARMDAEMAVFTDAERSLHEGRAAFARGDLYAAEHPLQVAAAHEMGDAVVYLAALHRRCGRDDLAAAWSTIATHAGFDDHDLAEVERITTPLIHETQR